MTRKVVRVPLVLAIFALALLWLMPTAAFGQHQTDAPAWGLSIKTAACAAGERVLLGEIAEPWGALPPQSWDKLAATELWSAPDRPGKAYVVSRQKLEEMLPHYLGKLAGVCTLPTGLTIQRGGTVLLREDLERAVRDQMEPKLAALQGRAELVRLTLPEVIFVDAPYSHMVVDTGDALEPGRLNVDVSLRTGDGTEIRRVRGTGFINHWVPVACAKRPINTREEFDASLVEYREMNMAYSKGETWDGTGGPWRMRRPVGAGQPILVSNMEIVPAVGRGQPVRLIYQGRNVRLQTTAKALADGAIGEMITVENETSGRTVQAVVVSQDTVAVR